jgi:NAD-dependent SIR2 family protein deacetylase
MPDLRCPVCHHWSPREQWDYNARAFLLTCPRCGADSDIKAPDVRLLGDEPPT